MARAAGRERRGGRARDSRRAAETLPERRDLRAGADWERLSNGDIDRAKERKLVELTAAEEADPPRTKLRTPLYQAKIEPDVYFFGFDLTVPAARGGSGEKPADPAGWFS